MLVVHLLISFSKQQGSVTSSTYTAEFSALRISIEEAHNLFYMLRCLRYNIPTDRSAPTRNFGHNLSVILNAQNRDADLSKKNVSISCHVVRESVATDIIESYWLKGSYKIFDIMNK